MKRSLTMLMNLFMTHVVPKPRVKIIFRLVVSCTIFICCLVNEEVRAQSPCDELLQPVEDPYVGYGPRSPRHCEGFYREAQSGAGITLVGYLYGKFRGPLEDTVFLRVHAPDEGHRQAHVRVTPFALKTYFQMDATLPVAEVWHWPMRILKRISSLSSTDLSIKAFVTVDETVLHLPIRWANKLEELQAERKLRAYFRAFSDLKDISYHFTTPGGGSSEWQQPFITSADSGDPISIDLSVLPPGQYKMRLTARERFTNVPVYSLPVNLIVP